MTFIEMFLEIADLIVDIRLGKRYGFGSFVWKIGFWICLFIAAMAFFGKLYILGTVVAAAAILCLVFSSRCFVRDIKNKRNEKTEESTQPRSSPTASE